MTLTDLLLTFADDGGKDTEWGHDLWRIAELDQQQAKKAFMASGGRLSPDECFAKSHETTVPLMREAIARWCYSKDVNPNMDIT